MTIPFCNAMMVKERQEMVKRVIVGQWKVRNPMSG